MNLRFQPLILALGLSLGTASAQEADSQIRFAHDNQLSGELVSFTGDRIVWKSPVLEEPASFLVKKVLEVTFPAETPSFEADHEATVTLKNGDVVRGQLVSVTDDEVQLGTWYAGTLKFRRVMVESLSIDDRPKLFYRGPSGLDGWIQNGAKDAWSYQANAFRITGGGAIGRVVETPDECRFLFTAEWRGDLRLSVHLFSDDLSTTDPQTGYRIAFERRMISLQKLGATQQIIGNLQQVNQLSVNEKARIEIRVSRKQGLVTLLIDDRIIANWLDADADPNVAGHGLQFSAQDGAAVKLSRIEVSSWDGHTENLPEMDLNGMRRFGGRIDPFNRFDGQQEPIEKPAAEEEGRMALRNGDSITGEVMSIEDGVIKIKTPHSEVSLPVSRLRTIALKPVALEEPKRNAGDVRAWFADGSSIVFRLEGMADGMITGYSQTFGTADFKASAFNRIEFNVQMVQLEALRGNKDW